MEIQMSGTKGNIDYATRRAFNKFDEWNNVSGMFEKHSGYYYEIQWVIEDAVHCGFQMALDQERPLPSEIDSLPLQSIDARYNDLLQHLGVNGHAGAVAEIYKLREICGLDA